VRFFFFASKSLTPELSDFIGLKHIQAQGLAGSFIPVRNWFLLVKIFSL
jgi:hypothetical protein